MRKLICGCDNTQVLQEMLDRCGNVVIPGGCYEISKTLEIHNHTRLILSADTVIRLADQANCNMLMNDCCDIEGTNYNITVEGGTWDGNNAAQTQGEQPDGKRYFFGLIMRFQGVEDLCIRDVRLKDPTRFATQLKEIDRFTVENITFDFNMLERSMDGVHVQGNARNGMIRNIKGATNDDLVALNCEDIYDDGKKRTKTMGDIENIVVDGVFADNGYTAVRLLSCGSRMRNISIRNIFGTYRFYGISFTNHNMFPGAPKWLDNIDISNVYCAKHPQDPPVDRKFIDGVDNAYGVGVHDESIKYSPIIWFEHGTNCGNVSISNVHRDEYAVTEAPTIQIDADVNIERLKLSNITQRFVNCPEVPVFVNNGNVKKLIED